MAQNMRNSVNELFEGMPYLLAYFKDIDGKIKHFRKVENGAEVERLQRKRKALLDTAMRLDSEDLQLIYYAKQIGTVGFHDILRAMQKLYHAQEGVTHIMKQGKTAKGIEDIIESE